MQSRSSPEVSLQRFSSSRQIDGAEFLPLHHIDISACRSLPPGTPETYVDLHSVSENELVNLRRSRSQGGARQAAADAESIQALPEVAKSRSRVGRRRSQRMDLNCHQPFAIVIIRPNAECDVPGVRRKRLS